MNSARSQAIQIAQEKLALNPLYLDTETTGIERNSEIIEICIVDDQGQLVFDSLVRPTGRIPVDAMRIHGISNEEVAGAPTWLQVWPQVQAHLANRHVGIYNAEFDLRLMQQTHARLGLRWPMQTGFFPFCIMKLYAQYVGEWNRQRGSYRWHSLETAGRQCGIPLANTHRASDDSLLARALLHFIAQHT